MKKLCLIVSVLVLNSYSLAALTEMSYTVENTSGSQWIYNYTITNLGLTEGIKEFTIWFEHGKYASLQKASDPALDTNWDQIAWQPNKALQNNGGFDALAKNDFIAIGQTVPDFAVRFEWQGEGEPGRQYYEIINPDSFDVITSGFTVPEPVSLLLIAVGGIYVRKSTKNH